MAMLATLYSLFGVVAANDDDGLDGVLRVLVIIAICLIIVCAAIWLIRSLR